MNLLKHCKNPLSLVIESLSLSVSSFLHFAGGVFWLIFHFQTQEVVQHQRTRLEPKLEAAAILFSSPLWNNLLYAQDFQQSYMNWWFSEGSRIGLDSHSQARVTATSRGTSRRARPAPSSPPSGSSPVPSPLVSSIFFFRLSSIHLSSAFTLKATVVPVKSGLH